MGAWLLGYTDTYNFRAKRDHTDRAEVGTLVFLFIRLILTQDANHKPSVNHSLFVTFLIISKLTVVASSEIR